MHYLHDNFKMHTIYKGKMQYSHYDPNPHYMLYLHDNLKMHTIYEGKMQYSHYDLNPHYMWEP
jgi:hypothetical protein